MLETPTENIPSSTPPPAKLTQKKRMIVTIILFTVLVLIFLFGASAADNLRQTLRTQPTPTQSITPTPNETANWKTYTNTKIGFQMKYPNRFGPPTVPVSEPPIKYADGSEDNIGVFFGEGSSDFIDLGITPFTGTLVEFVRFTSGPNTTFTIKKKLSVGGVGAEWIIDKEPGMQEIYFVNRAHGFLITTNKNYSEDELTQILSTFKFIDATPSATPKPTASGSGETVTCTQEAKLCPDGSYVGRTGPNCEFAKCP